MKKKTGGEKKQLRFFSVQNHVEVIIKSAYFYPYQHRFTTTKITHTYQQHHHHYYYLYHCHFHPCSPNPYRNLFQSSSRLLTRSRYLARFI